MKSSYFGAEPSSTALSHAHPRPSSNTTSRAVRTRCLRVEDAVGLRALRVADEHSRSAPVVELADVAKLFGEREAAEDPHRKWETAGLRPCQASYDILPSSALVGERLRM